MLTSRMMQPGLVKSEQQSAAEESRQPRKSTYNLVPTHHDVREAKFLPSQVQWPGLRQDQVQRLRPDFCENLCGDRCQETMDSSESFMSSASSLPDSKSATVARNNAPQCAPDTDDTCSEVALASQPGAVTRNWQRSTSSPDHPTLSTTSSLEMYVAIHPFYPPISSLGTRTGNFVHKVSSCSFTKQLAIQTSLTRHARMHSFPLIPSNFCLVFCTLSLLPSPFNLFFSTIFPHLSESFSRLF